MEAEKGDSEFEAAKHGLEKVFPGANTLAECLRYHYETRLSEFWEKLPNRDVVKRQFLRRYQPWPDWVLWCAVEVYRVFFPRINKQVIFESFKLFHDFIFEARFDETERKHPPIYPKINAEVLGTVVGHLLAVAEHAKGQFDDLVRDGKLSQGEIAEFQAKHGKHLSEAEFHREVQPHLMRYLSIRPADLVQFSDAMAVARRNTFDANGGLKETTSTKVYSKILEDWPQVEEMSGATELCTFLNPLLVGSENDPAKKLDRVKKIRQRLKIRFRRVVKG